MAFVDWNQSFELGVKKFDDHHRHLIDLINRLDDALQKESEQENLGEILKELLDYTIYHFHAEEEYMKGVHFDGLEAHIQMHHAFIAELQSHVTAFLEGKKIVIALLAFLTEWLIDHISVVDRKYANFARIRGVHLPQS